MHRVLLVVAGVLTFAAVAADEASHEEAARELLTAMNAEQTIEQSYTQILPQLEAMAEQMGVTGEERVIFDRYLRRMVAAMREELTWEKMEPGMVRTYMSVYSEQELRELAEFYESPLGQKFTRKMPELMTATMQMTQDMMEDFAPRVQEIQARLEAELRVARGGRR